MAAEGDAYDLVVIGSGPGGYIGAIRAAQLGMKVACVERYDTYGGTCLNVGCIPSKALLESSERLVEAREGLEAHGVEIGGEVKLNLGAMMSRKDEIVSGLVGGVAGLFDKNGVDGVHGHATILSANTVEVRPRDGEGGEARRLETKRILIATGSKPISLPGITIDKDRVVDSTGALSLPEVPEHLIVIGAGVIGLELGSVWARLGAKVTVLEYLPKILGPYDKDISRLAQRIFKRQGMEFELGARVTGAEVDGETVTVTYEFKGEEKSLQGDRLLVAVGRMPYTQNLGLENVGVETDKRGFIHVNEEFGTNVAGIYAIGDVIPGPMLAHKAEEEAVVCVERMNGIGAHVNYDAIPDVVYTHPEIASVGKSEQDLEEAGVEVKVGKFYYKGNARARALHDTEGFAKIIADASTDRVLGAAIIGARAGDMIAELAIAMEFGASSEDIARTSHAHPTLAEIVKEAALAVEGRSLNS